VEPAEGTRSRVGGPGTRSFVTTRADATAAWTEQDGNVLVVGRVGHHAIEDDKYRIIIRDGSIILVEPSLVCLEGCKATHRINPMTRAGGPCVFKDKIGMYANDSLSLSHNCYDQFA
jgi:hypothetical protein